MSRLITKRQQRFVEEYSVDLNATAAAKRAGYSLHTARQIGAENLSKPYIAQLVSDQLEQRSIAIGCVGEMRTEELWRFRYADIADILDERGIPKPVDKMPVEFRQGLIVSMKIRVEDGPNGPASVRIISIKFSDRSWMMRELGRRCGAWKKGTPTPAGGTANYR